MISSILRSLRSLCPSRREKTTTLTGSFITPPTQKVSPKSRNNPSTTNSPWSGALKTRGGSVCVNSLWKHDRICDFSLRWMHFSSGIKTTWLLIYATIASGAWYSQLATTTAMRVVPVVSLAIEMATVTASISWCIGLCLAIAK